MAIIKMARVDGALPILRASVRRHSVFSRPVTALLPRGQPDPLPVSRPEPMSGGSSNSGESGNNGISLSTGAIVGTVIGAFVIGFGFLLLAAILHRRYRKKKRRGPARKRSTRSVAVVEDGLFRPTTDSTREKSVSMQRDPEPRPQLEPYELNGVHSAKGSSVSVANAERQPAQPEQPEQPTPDPVSPISRPATPDRPAPAPPVQARLSEALQTGTMQSGTFQLGTLQAGVLQSAIPATWLPAENAAASEIQRLRQKHASLEVRRQALLELQRIEAEQDALLDRIRALETGGGNTYATERYG